MITRCVNEGPYQDRLRAGSVYTVYEIDLKRLRIRIDDLTGFNWYPSELFEIDLVSMSEDDAEKVRMSATRFRLFTTKDAFGEAYRGSVRTTKSLIVELLGARGIEPTDYSIDGLLRRMRDVLSDPVPYGEGRSAQDTIEACYRRLTRILGWLERVMPEVVTVNELEQCFRVSRQLHVRWREARNELARCFGIDLSQPRK